MKPIKDSDFIVNGYNKYHLWTYLYYQYLINPKLQDKTRQERKQMAVETYLELLGKNNAKKMS